MRCEVYVRVSTDNQRDNGYSIDSQLRMIKKYCEKNNYDIEIIKDMDLENKLRLAICMCDDYSHTNLVYNKKEMYK